jgi:hypothetical protein
MKNNLLLFILLCFAKVGFAQLKVNNAGNAGIYFCDGNRWIQNR